MRVSRVIEVVRIDPFDFSYFEAGDTPMPLSNISGVSRGPPIRIIVESISET